MSNTMHFNSIQTTPQATLYNYQPQPHHRHRHHHHLPPLPTTQPAPIHNPSSYSNHRLNNSSNSNSYVTRPAQVTTPLSSNYQTAAYFLDRTDLENYTSQTLKQTVENILSKTKSKGLKVKISLPDDGLIIENITDPNQSWIFKTSELLYFWRDPHYLNVIVVVTINRAQNQYNRPYSASIFRLRGGTDSAQLFLQQAQQFFSNLQTLVNNSSNLSKSTRNKSAEKTLRTDNSVSSSTNKTKSLALSTINEQMSNTIKANPDQQPNNIRRVTRAEFDPGKIVGIHSVEHRTYSETASSTDSQTNNSTRKLNEDDDDRFTTVSNNLSMDQVAELMRELKELRNEIATLKLGKKPLASTRSMSTSPLTISPENAKRTNDSSASTSSPSFQEATSQSEVDAETQTDYSFVSHRRRQTPRKNKKTMIGSGGVSNIAKKKPSPSTPRNGRRTFSNSSTNTVSDQEEPSLPPPPPPPDRSSQMNDSITETNPTHLPEQYQPFILAAPPRPMLMRNSTNFTALTNSTEEGSFNGTAEKDMPKFLSSNISSSKSDMIGPTMSVIPNGSTSHFRPSIENSTNHSTEHIYENVPILIQPNSNADAFYNIPIINADESQQQQAISSQTDTYVYYTINKSREIDSSQQQYLIPGQIISNSPPTTDNNNNNILDSQSLPVSRQKPQIVSTGRHRNQPIFFANHLTNPVFNVDKQLLINTIANQFGFDLNSPQLQQLISNQHLFAARKRTFANMVWQLTPDEETALCSSPLMAAQTAALFDPEALNLNNNSTARSILKATKRLQTSDKRRNITWDNALE